MIPRRFLLLAVLGALAACATPTAPEARRADARVESLELVPAVGRPVRFNVEVVDNDATRERGLMYRRSLGPNAGMLFDFQSPRSVSFWMKNTYIPLDIIFIAPDGAILNIAERATPLSETPLPSAGPVRGVLEIAGGRAAALGVRAGDKVRHRIFAGGG